MNNHFVRRSNPLSHIQVELIPPPVFFRTLVLLNSQSDPVFIAAAPPPLSNILIVEPDLQSDIILKA